MHLYSVLYKFKNRKILKWSGAKSYVRNGYLLIIAIEPNPF